MRRGVAESGAAGQCLQLDQERPRAFQQDGDGRTRRVGGTLLQEGLGGVGDFHQAGGAHLKDADLARCAEAVLDAAQEAEGLEGIAFQVEHGVDDVLEYAWAGAMLPSLVTWPTSNTLNAPALARCCSWLAHSRIWADHPRRRIQRFAMGGLDRIDDEQRRIQLVDGGEDALEVGFGEQVEGVVSAIHAEAARAHAQLAQRFLAADVEHAPERGGHRACQLREQGGFADARFAAEQGDAAGDEAAAQHAAHLADGDGQAFLVGGGDIGEAAGVRCGDGGFMAAGAGGWRFGDGFHRVELAAGRAASELVWRLAAAFAATVAGARAGHWPQMSVAPNLRRM